MNLPSKGRCHARCLCDWPRWHKRVHGALLGAAAALGQPGLAAPAVDPTLPPSGWNATAGGAQSPTTASTPDSQASGGASLAIVGQARRVAIIKGQPVRQGDTIDGYRVIAIGTRQVVLEGSDGTRILPLTPGVEIRSRPTKQP